MVLDRRMFRRPSQIAPNKGPSSKGVGITSGLTQPVKMETGGDVASKYKEYLEELSPITEEMYPKQSFFERAGMSPFQFFAALGTPMQPGQTVLGKIGEAGQYLDIKPESTAAKDLASKIALEKALQEDEEELITVAKGDRVIIKDPTSESGYREIIPSEEGLDLEGLPMAVKYQKLFEAGLINEDLLKKGLEKELSIAEGRQYPSVEEQAKIDITGATINTAAEYVQNNEQPLIDEGIQAEATISNLLGQLEIIDAATSGSGQSIRENLDRLIQTFGLDETAPDVYEKLSDFLKLGNLPATEALGALQQFFTLTKTDFLPGNLNNTEIGLLKNSGPQLFMTKEGQKFIADINLKDAEIKRDGAGMYADFKRTGILKDPEGNVLYDVSTDEYTPGLVDVMEQQNAIQIVNNWKSLEYSKFGEATKDRVQTLLGYAKPKGQSFFDDLANNKKIIKFNNDTYDLSKEYTNNNLQFLGYSDETGSFTYDDGTPLKTNKPNQPVYGLLLKDKQTMKFFDFDM